MKKIKEFNQLMDCYSSNRDNFSALIRFMRRNVVIPFLGAGFSANYGYKTWGEFLEEQNKESNLQGISEALKSGKYEKGGGRVKKSAGYAYGVRTYAKFWGPYL